MVLPRTCRLALACALIAGLSSTGWADGDTSQASLGSSQAAASPSNRFSAGLRWSKWWLEDSRRSGDNGLDNDNTDINFVGSLWGLDTEPRYVPFPFVEYRIVSVVGVGAAYDEALVKTLDWANADKTTTAGDGELRLRGLQVYAFASYPNRTRLTPYARVGYAHYWSTFLPTAEWLVPGRSFVVGDTQGWLVGASLRARLTKHLDFDVSYDHLGLEDVPATAHLLSGGERTGAFPMRSDSLRTGLAYRF
jgi:opacity protein-like surface antigen